MINIFWLIMMALGGMFGALVFLPGVLKGDAFSCVICACSIMGFVPSITTIYKWIE